MNDKDYKLFIVEGEVREPLIIDNISKVFFKHAKFKVITLPAGQNIYMLWKRLKEDDFETDIIEILREANEKIERQLLGLKRNDFSEIYLFFDYDGHQENLGEVDDINNVIEQMLVGFDNETENGKLYISYPMVEALRDFEEGRCGKRDNCYIKIDEICNYKTISAIRAIYPQFKLYNYPIWKEVIDVFVMRISCLMNYKSVISYEQYVKMISPFEIYKYEEIEILNNRVFILSAFPEFLLEYFGVKLWRDCVNNVVSYKEFQKCK